MLIPDLLNILFDQSDYQTLMCIKSLQRSKTKYAVKYSVLVHYQHEENHVKNRYKLKILKHVIYGDLDAEALNCLSWWGDQFGDIYEEMIKYLADTDLGANLHYMHCQALVVMASRGDRKMTMFLLSRGADDSVCYNQAFMLSVGNGHLEIVKCLINFGSYPQDYYDPWSMRRIVDKNSVMMKYLVSVGANGEKVNEW